VYKLVEIESDGVMRPVMKRSVGKSTWPGRKQVWRVLEGGVAARDVIGLEPDAPPPAGEALLEIVMRDGRRVGAPPALDDLRRRRAEMVAMLPPAFRELSTPIDYDVEQTPALSRAIT
jgi:nicotinate phosphoribosyltransferase